MSKELLKAILVTLLKYACFWSLLCTGGQCVALHTVAHGFSAQVAYPFTVRTAPIWEKSEGWDGHLDSEVPQPLHQCFLEYPHKQKKVMASSWIWLIYWWWDSPKQTDTWLKIFSRLEPEVNQLIPGLQCNVRFGPALLYKQIELQCVQAPCKSWGKIISREICLWNSQRLGKSRQRTSSEDEDEQMNMGGRREGILRGNETHPFVWQQHQINLTHSWLLVVHSHHKVFKRFHKSVLVLK